MSRIGCVDHTVPLYAVLADASQASPEPSALAAPQWLDAGRLRSAGIPAQVATGRCFVLAAVGAGDYVVEGR